MKIVWETSLSRKAVVAFGQIGPAVAEKRKESFLSNAREILPFITSCYDHCRPIHRKSFILDPLSIS